MFPNCRSVVVLGFEPYFQDSFLASILPCGVTVALERGRRNAPTITASSKHNAATFRESLRWEERGKANLPEGLPEGISARIGLIINPAEGLDSAEEVESLRSPMG